jgi:hypothetical protein
MSDIFHDREKQAERMFVHDQEQRFKARVRADRLMGLWVASKLGLKGAEAEAYAKSLTETALEKGGDARLIERILADFKARNVGISEHRVRRHMAECEAEARAQIKKEVK